MSKFQSKKLKAQPHQLVSEKNNQRAKVKIGRKSLKGRKMKKNHLMKIV
jgi:hypothetical protein